MSPSTHRGGTGEVYKTMPVFIAACLIALVALGLGFYTVRKMNPGSFRLDTSVWRVISFRIEIQSGSAHEELLAEPGAEDQAKP